VNLTRPLCLTRAGHLKHEVSRLGWPERLGDWEEVLALCSVLVEFASPDCEISGLHPESVKVLLQREGIIAYDDDSGLWYCFVRQPKQDYEEGWKSPARIKRDASRALFCQRLAEKGLIPEPSESVSLFRPRIKPQKSKKHPRRLDY